MAATPEEISTLKSRLDGLNQAIAEGVRQVTIGDSTVTFNTTDSLMRARDDVQAQLTAASNSVAERRVPRQTQLVYGGRGYY